jgi:membrane associated rhomboid family serine protease
MRLQLTPVVKLLAITNVAVFLLPLLFGMETHEANSILGLRYIGASTFHVYQLVTHFFAHADFFHLLFNMMGLISFGPILESRWGAKKFLFFYIFCALGAAALDSGVKYYEMNKIESAMNLYISDPSPETFLSFVRKIHNTKIESATAGFVEDFEKEPESPDAIAAGTEWVKNIYFAVSNYSITVGASGAIFGLLAAFALLFPNTELMLMFIPFPIKAKYFVPIYAAIELFMGVSRFQWDSIAHFAHLGGALFGFILVKYWQKQRNTFY